jgi:hypothetical protein
MSCSCNQNPNLNDFVVKSEKYGIGAKSGKEPTFIQKTISQPAVAGVGIALGAVITFAGLKLTKKIK